MSSSRPGSDTPFRILVLGDFGANAPSRPMLIDRDNFDRVMERLDVRLELPGAGVMRFKEIDDFHPDRLFESLPLFRGLSEMRGRIEDPATFRQTASELMPREQQAPQRAEPRPQVPIDFLSSGSLLDQVMESTEEPSASAAAPARGADPFQKYLNAIVAPHLEPRPDPKQAELLEQVDSATAAQMRALLHVPRFQSLEAAWRGLFFLVRNVETDADLKIYLLHLPKKALRDDLAPANDLKRTEFYRVLVKETVSTPGAEPWSLVAAAYTFSSGSQDIDLLGRIALLASAAICPMIARAGAALLGEGPDLAEWNELLSIPEANYIGLALPRFLLRLPYGKETTPTDRFPFEEMPAAPKHDDYLWGSPSFACACLIAQAFSESGWEMQPGDSLDIAGLPAHIYKKDGEAVMKPCAEVLMTQSEAEELMKRGLIPLLSFKDTDRIHVAGFRAINTSHLAGRWS